MVTEHWVMVDSDAEADEGGGEVGFDPTMTVTLTDLSPAARPQPRRQEPGPLQVEVIGGPMDGTRCSVEGDELTIGRSQPNDLHLSLDPMVSGDHARVTREDEHYWLADRESRNGTYLGDHQLDGRVLITPGSCFLVGCTLIEFMPH
ncbi:MAG: pSer/pThr/pTyr-binding forkhead associated (FHA) protein [Pseudohongiellaceae bacterium]|jgi:pSer/pThr/pTyr-binding forkhead associated (FHA) protein